MRPHTGTTRGFKRTSTLLQKRIAKAGESRGFAVSRLLTQWPEVVGQDLAAMARPVDVSYGRGGMGATLTVLTTGAQAPMLDMQKGALRERVNAVYGYNAIVRVRITQTAPTGFAEGRVQFAPASKAATRAPDPALQAQAAETAAPVGDADLRAALEKLALNVLTKSNRRSR